MGRDASCREQVPNWHRAQQLRFPGGDALAHHAALAGIFISVQLCGESDLTAIANQDLSERACARMDVAMRVVRLWLNAQAAPVVIPVETICVGQKHGIVGGKIDIIAASLPSKYVLD